MVVSNIPLLSLIAASIALSIIKSNPSVVMESIDNFSTSSASGTADVGVVETSPTPEVDVVTVSRVASRTAAPVVSAAEIWTSSDGTDARTSVLDNGGV